MPILKKVPSYVKNVAKSVAYSTVDVMKTDMPTVSAFLDNESNKDVGKIVYDNIKDLQSIRMLGRNTALALRRSKVWEAGELGIKSAMEDIRTGKWYNKDRISMIEEQVLEETMGGWDDMDLDMDSMEFGESNTPTKGDKLIAASVQIAVGKSADQISETTVNAANAIMNQQKKSTELMYAQNFKLANEIRATVTNIGNKTNVYLDNIQSINKTIAENNKKFFETSTKLMQESNSMMKEMIEMQRNLYRNQQEINKQREKENAKKKTGYNDLVSMEGVLDFKEYGKYVKKNSFKVLDEQSGGMLSMMFGGFDGSGKGNMLKTFASSPLSFLSNMLVSQLIPKNVKKSTGKLDTTIAGIAPTLLGNLNKAGKNSDNPLAQIIGKIFGVDTRVQNKIDTSKYEKGPMQFNGKANKSIVEVLPELMSDILSALTGQPKKLYDFDKGKWTTGRAIKREFDQMTKSNMKSSFSDLMGEMKDYIGGGKGPKFSTRDQATRFEQTLETFLTVLYNNDGSFNSKKDYEMYQLAGVSKSDYDMIAKMIQNIGKRNHGVRMGLSASVMSSKQSLNNQMKALQDKGGIFSYLFNGTDANKLYKTPKYEESPIGIGMDLNKTLDSKGNNVFYYLQNIYDEMYRIRMFGFGINGHSGWKNGPSPGKPFNESIYNISRIENNRKPSAKDKYNEGQRTQDARYLEMIEKHTKSGGKLYDLVDDRGNINLINATAEQKQIADMIEQARASGGFLQDTLFGQSSALDRDNSKRANKDESQINAKKFLDRLKQSKTLEDKFKVLSDQAKRGTRGSANITANIITRADDAIYEFFFGDETGEEDNNNKTIKGFMNLMKNKMNNALDKGLGFIDEKILSPIKKKTGADSLRDWFLEKTGLKGLFDSAKHWLLGDEGQKNGFLHTLGDETKNLFKKAGGFVGNSFKTVFSPVTDRVKSGWQKLNQPNVTEEELSLSDLGADSGSSTVQSIVRNSISQKNSFEKSLILFRGLRRAQMLAEELTNNSTDLDTVIKAINYVNTLQKEATNDPRAKKKFDIIRKGLLNRKKDLLKAKADGGGRISSMGSIADGDTLDRSIQNSIARSQELLYSNNDKYARQHRRDNYANPKVFNEKIEKFASNFLKKMQISTNYTSVLVGVISDYVYQEANSDKTEFRIQKMNSITASEMCSRLTALGTNRAIALSQLIESAMINKNGNIDSTLGELHNKGISSNTSGNNNPPIMSLMGEAFTKMYNLINSIVDHQRMAIRVTTKSADRPNPNPLGGNNTNNNRGSRNRENRTEGRSSGSDDGGVTGAAYGANFDQSSISALSEGEIYGRNGLYGKVPKTGVYNVKAGTTIIPTKKDKAIEVAKEQDVINKAVYSNANAKGQRTRQYNGHTYTELTPGKWTAYWQDEKGKSFKDVRTEEQFNLAFRTKQVVRSGAEAVIDGLGINSQLNSIDGMPKNLQEAKALITKYAPKLGAGAILGGAIGLLAGNPILGAAIGGTASVVSVSEQAKTFLFGEKLHDEEGNETGRAGGLVSSGAQDAIKKYFPSMAKYGTVGATLGLLSPFGLVGGALIGSSIGWANSNDAIREALFGKSDDPKSGLMSQETRNKLKKAMPNVIVGAGLGVLTGPFGILGNALLGSGLGLVSTTEGFKSLILGTEYVNPDGTKSREGGLMGSIRTHVIDPLKEFGTFFKTKMEDMFINGIINPIKESIKPLTKDFYLLAKGALAIFPNMVNSLFSSTFGRPLTQLIDDKIISPIANITNKLARGAVGAGAGIISAPFKAVRGIARSRQMAHIQTGNADYMTAADRLQFRKDHKIRSMGGDSYKSTDEVMNLMNKNELKTSLDSMKVLQNVNKLKKDEKAAGRALSAEVTKYFGTKGATWKQFKAAMESNNIEQFSQLLDTIPMSNGQMMSQAQKDNLIQLANVKLSAVDTSRRKQNLTKDKEKELFRELKQKGFNVNAKNVDKISSMLQNEYNLKSRSEKKLTPEEEAANTVTDNAKKNTQDIITTLQESTKLIAKILNDNAPDTDRSKSNAKFIDEYFGSRSDTTNDTISPEEEQRRRDLEEAQNRARSESDGNIPNSSNRRKGNGWWNKIYGNAKQYANDLANPRTRRTEAYIDGTDIPVIAGEEETNVPNGLARLLGAGINKKNSAVGKINAFYNKGKQAFGEELDNVKHETKEVFDPAANAFRSFRRGMNGEWVENSGKAQTNADKAETQAQNDQMNKLGLTIGSAIGKVFGSTDKETGEKKEGLLSKLFGAVKGPLGKLAKTAGLGLLGATVVAGIGHGSESLFPKISDMWTNKIQPWMNETFNGLGDKLISIKDNLIQIPIKLFNWATGKSEGGGLPTLFKDKILPWYLDGFGSFATTFLPPIVETLVKSIPSLVKGIGKGVMNGIRALVFKDDKYHSDFDNMKTDTKVTSSKAYNSKSNLSSVPSNGGTAWWKQGSSSSGFDGILSGLDGMISGGTSGIQGKTKSERVKDKESYQDIINNPNATENEKQSAIASAAANAAVYGPNGEILYDYRYMLKDKKGNTIDANGNYTNDNSNAIFDPFGGAVSLQDRAFKGITRRILTPGASNLPLKALSGVGKVLSKTPGLGLMSGGTRLVGNIAKGAGDAGQALTRVSDRVMGGIMTENVGDLAYKLGSNSRFAQTGADAVAQKALQRTASKGAFEVGEEIISETGTKFVVEQTEKGAKKVVKSSVGELAEGASTGLAGKLSTFIKNGMEKIFNSGPVKKAITKGMESVGKVASSEIIKKVSDTIIGKLVKKAVDGIKKAAAAVVAKVSASLATANIAAIAFAAWDFGSGMADARSILGLTKDQEVSWVERIIAGFLKCINGILTWGLIPESFIVDVFIEHLAPLLGVDVEDIQKRREEATAEVTAYNDANGTDYTIEEYNKRNSLGTKFMKGAKGLVGKADQNTVAEYNAAHGTNLTLEEYESQHTIGGKIKGVGSKAIKAVGSGISNLTKGIKNLGSDALKGIGNMVGYVKSGNIGGLIKSTVDWRNSEGELNAGQALTSIMTSVALPVLAPVTLGVGGIKLLGKGISALTQGIISEGSNAVDKVKETFGFVKSGDVVGLLSSISSVRTEEGDVSIGRILVSALTGTTLPFTLIPTAVVGAGKFISDSIGKIVSAVSNTGDLIKTNSSAIKDLARQGELKKMFSYEVEKGEDNPLGFIQTGVGIANKLFQAPIAAFHALGNGINDLLGVGKSDNKIVKISDVISEMKEYMDTDKHATMDGWDNIGSKYTNASGPMGIINRLIVNSVKGIGKHVVNIVRGFGGIIDLIDKIPGVNIKGDKEAESGTGKYGLGRVSQIDPNVANVKFNSPGDSKKQTIGNSGCGPAAAVNAVNYAYGTGPGELLNASKYAINGGWKERNGGTKPGFFSSYLSRKGLKASHIGNASIPQSLASGNPVILMGKDPNGDNTPYGPNPHYVVAKGLDNNGNMIIDDPESTNPDLRYPVGKVLGKTSMAIRASKYGMAKGGVKFNLVNSAGVLGNKINEVSDKVVALKPKVTTKESVIVSFATLGWLDKPFSKMVQSGGGSPNGAINSLCSKYRITIKSEDMNKTVKGILTSYFNISSSVIDANKRFAKDIAVYVDIPCSELKSTNNSLHSLLKSLIRVCNGINIEDTQYEKKTVGSMCNMMGLTFDGEKPKTSNSSIGADMLSSVDYNMMGSDSLSSIEDPTSQQQESKSIFDMFKSSFVSLFDYTGADGNKTNLLSLFGLDSSSGSGISTTSTGATNGVAGGLSGPSANNFPYYDQSDPQWGQKPYGKSGTISSSGCGPTSMAMILKSFGNSLTPLDTANWSAQKGFRVVGSGTGWEFFKSIGQQYGINTKRIAENESTMVSSLRAGFPMISSMRPGDFTKGGHFIVLSGIDNSGNILVNDPAGSAGKARSAKGWSPSTIASQSKQMWIFDKNGKGSIGSMALSNTASSLNLGSSAPTDIEKNKAIIWKFLKSKGYNDIAAAGIMGNIGQECGFNYSLTQKGASNPGLGICQWTYKTRKAAFLAAVPDWETNLPGQLNFMWNEINSGYRGCLPESMNKCTSVTDAVWKFHQIYEGSADIQRTGGLAKREGYGSQVYSQFANTSMGNTMYGTSKYGLGSVVDGQVTSGFNDPTRISHSGVDIAANRGTPVKSPTSGTVIRAEENAENGKMVVVQDGTGRLYTFSHLQSSNVRVGSKVAPNTIIGTVGSTGNSSGNHLHYQMTNPDGQFVDPVSYAMGKKTSPASKQPSRAIGGSNGIDYTTLLNNVIQLLAIIGTNTEKINALVDAMAKMGVDTSNIDTTSNESKINAIKSSLSNGINRSTQASTVTNEIEGQRLEKMTNIMRTIAAQ